MIDWETYRAEAAKDILCSLLGRVERFYTGVKIEGRTSKLSDHSDFIRVAIEDAQELVEQLKQLSPKPTNL